MIKDDKTHWLTRRLKELGKTKTDFAKCLDVNNARIYELENGLWKFQVSHIRKAAEFLEFDCVKFLDFVSGDITEEDLWQAKPEPKISEEDLALLRAVKSIAARQETTPAPQNTSQPPTIQKKDNER